MLCVLRDQMSYERRSLIAKPKMFGENYAVRFKDQSVVDVYHFRPPYTNEVFDVLEGLIVDDPKTVLDVCYGTDDIARRLIDRGERVDAVDFSEGMIEKGKRSPNGDKSKPALDSLEG